jgi:hypothetical protein
LATAPKSMSRAATSRDSLVSMAGDASERPTTPPETRERIYKVIVCRDVGEGVGLRERPLPPPLRAAADSYALPADHGHCYVVLVDMAPMVIIQKVV